MTIIEKYKISTFVILLTFTLVQSAIAASFIDKSKTVTCKNGSSSTSAISLAKAICGCAKKGGAVGHSNKNCPRLKNR